MDGLGADRQAVSQAVSMGQKLLIGAVFAYFLSVYPQYRTALIFVLVLGLTYWLRPDLNWALRWRKLARFWPVLALPLGGLLLSPLALNPTYALISSLKFLVEITAGLGLLCVLRDQPKPVQDHLTMAAAYGTILGSLLITGDALSGGLVFGWFKVARSELQVMNSNSAPLAISVIMLPILIQRLIDLRRYVTLMVYVVAVTVSVFVLWQWAAKLGVVVAITGLGAGLLWRRFWMLPAAGLALGLISAFPAAMSLDMTNPALCSLWSKPSSVHRLLIWHEVALKIAERPMLGYGIEAARFFPDAEDRVKLDQCAAIVGVDDPYVQMGFQRLPIYPHNVFLEIWLSLGAVGIAISLCLLGVIAARLAASDKAVQAISAGVLSVVCVYFTLGYSLWQGWWIATLLTAASFAWTARTPSNRTASLN
jgi:O-antigen ligase